MTPILALALSTLAAGQGLQSRPPTRSVPARKAVAVYTARIASTPDINQHMTWEQFLKQIPKPLHAKYTPPAEIGVKSKVFFQNFCGPCSVADNLIYLRGFYPQIHGEADPVAAGTFLARNLGFNYLGTVTEPDPEDLEVATGTGSSYKGLVKGTVQFLKERGVPVKGATVIGFRAHDSERAKYGHPALPIEIRQRAPSLDEVRSAIRQRTVVVLHYGHYEYMPARAGGKARSYLRRTGGHYIAPVGYGLDDKNKPHPDWIIANDPAGSYQDQQRQVHHLWVRQPKGTFQNLELLNWRGDEPIRHPSLADPNRPQFESFGTLATTYVRDAPVASPKGKQRYEVLEGLIVIRM